MLRHAHHNRKAKSHREIGMGVLRPFTVSQPSIPSTFSLALCPQCPTRSASDQQSNPGTLWAHPCRVPAAPAPGGSAGQGAKERQARPLPAGHFALVSGVLALSVCQCLLASAFLSSTAPLSSSSSSFFFPPSQLSKRQSLLLLLYPSSQSLYLAFSWLVLCIAAQHLLCQLSSRHSFIGRAVFLRSSRTATVPSRARRRANLLRIPQISLTTTLARDSSLLSPRLT